MCLCACAVCVCVWSVVICALWLGLGTTQRKCWNIELNVWPSFDADDDRDCAGSRNLTNKISAMKNCTQMPFCLFSETNLMDKNEKMNEINCNNCFNAMQSHRIIMVPIQCVPLLCMHRRRRFSRIRILGISLPSAAHKCNCSLPCRHYFILISLDLFACLYDETAPKSNLHNNSCGRWFQFLQVGRETWWANKWAIVRTPFTLNFKMFARHFCDLPVGNDETRQISITILAIPSRI